MVLIAVCKFFRNCIWWSTYNHWLWLWHKSHFDSQPLLPTSVFPGEIALKNIDITGGQVLNSMKIVSCATNRCRYTNPCWN